MEITEVTGIAQPRENGEYSLTELGTAERYTDCFGEDLLWVADTEKWKRYNTESGLWEDVTPNILYNNVGVIATLVERDIASIPNVRDDDGNEVESRLAGEVRKYVRGMRGLGHAKHALEYVKGRLACEQADFDANPSVLGLPGGKVIDLVSMEIKEAAREYRLTKKLNGNFMGNVSEEFNNFIFKILPDTDVLNYVQKYLGSALLGYKLRKSDDKKVLFIDSSVPNTGKSTLLSLLEKAMGDYYRTSTIGILTDTIADSNKPNPSLAELQGARIAGISEISANTKFASDNFKRLSGNDTVSARYPHDRRPFYYKPDFRILVVSNELPRPDKNDDIAFRSRFRRITFTTSIKDPDVNVALKFENQEFMDSAVTWLINGCKKYIEEGLDDYNGSNLEMSNLPLNLKSAIKKYVSENDDIGDFFRTFFKFTNNDKDFLTFKGIYDTWKDYANDKVGYYLWRRDVKAFLKQAGIKHGRKAHMTDIGKVINPTVIFGIKALETKDFYSKNEKSGYFKIPVDNAS